MNKKDVSNKLNEALNTDVYIRFEKLTNQEINQLVEIFSNPQKLMVEKIKGQLSGLFQKRVGEITKQIFNGKIIKGILGDI